MSGDFVLPMDPKHFFEGVRFLGRVKARRVTYFVYDSGRRYLLVWPSRRQPRSYFLSEVPRAYVEKVHRRFRGKRTTSVEVRRRVRGAAFQPLASLLILAASGSAKMKPSRSGALEFRVFGGLGQRE